jgi:hypothetical protein
MTDSASKDDSIVKKGGTGSDADAADVTRDTYGFAEGAHEGDEESKSAARRELDEILPDDELQHD